MWGNEPKLVEHVCISRFVVYFLSFYCLNRLEKRALVLTNNSLTKNTIDTFLGLLNMMLIEWGGDGFTLLSYCTIIFLWDTSFVMVILSFIFGNVYLKVHIHRLSVFRIYKRS